MANYRALTHKAGIRTQLADADVLHAGAGVDASVAQAFAVGASNASAVNVSKAGATSTIKGALTVDQTSTFTGAGEFDSTLGADGNFRVGAAGASNFTVAAASGNTLVGGTLDAATIDRAGAIAIGGTNGTAITISRAGQLTTIAGNLSVTGTETVVGATTFQSTVAFGDTHDDTVTFKGAILSDQIAKPQAAGGAGLVGNAYTFTAGTGAASNTGAGDTAGAGGAVAITGGVGGAGNTAVTGHNAAAGGALTLMGGTGGAVGAGQTNGNGGALTLDAGPAGAGAGTAGTNGAVQLGNTNATSVGIGRGGITTTVTGRFDATGGAVNLTANAASQITTSAGALTITAVGASTWSTATGAALTLASGTANDGGNALNLKTGTANRLVIADAAITVQAGVTLGTTGTGMINLPALFQIAGVAVSANVTSPNLGTLTAGVTSNADALHMHAVGAVSTAYNAGEAIDAGELVSLANNAGAPNWYKSDADDATNNRNVPVGIALAAAALGAAGRIALNGGEVDVATAQWDVEPAVADVGKFVYMSLTAGNLTITAPTAAGQRSQKVGVVSRGGVGAARVAIQIGDPNDL